MEKTVMITITIEELQMLIIDCVNACLQHDPRLKNLETQQPPDQWFNLSQLCEYHPDEPTKATVYGWVNQGKIPVHKGGKKLRFLKSEIDQWLRGKL